jgi:hypothetical protein
LPHHVSVRDRRSQRKKYWNFNWPAAKASREPAKPMSLLLVYLALIITGDVIAYLIGLVIERSVPAASLPAFLAMFFLVLWVAGCLLCV